MSLQQCRILLILIYLSQYAVNAQSPRNTFCSDTKVFLRDIHTNQARKPGSTKEIILQFEVRRVESIAKSISVHMDGYLIQKWQAGDYLTSQYPCLPSVSITEYANGLWKPSIAFENGEHIVYHKHARELLFSTNQTIIWRERVEQTLHCTVDPQDFPFGILSCPMKLSATDPNIVYKWAKMSPNISVGHGGVSESSSELRVHSVQPVQSEPGSRAMTLAVEVRREANKPLAVFFLPSIIFMAMSWLTLALGPMAITRAVIIVGSFVLLLMHYGSAQLNLPDTDAITGVDIWRLFSLFFVLASLLELVLVTCMASVGRSRKLSQCSSGRRGKYDVDAVQYEELNDLRLKRSSGTCGCCRISALVIDCIVMLLLLVIFVVFSFFFFTRGRKIVECVNRFRISDLLVF